MVRDLIELDPQEVSRFLGVSFRKDDQLIIDLIEASKDAADDCLGDIFEFPLSNINDFEQYADTAALVSELVGTNATLTLETGTTLSGVQSMKLVAADAGSASFRYTMPNVQDFRKVHFFRMWIKGDTDNPAHGIRVNVIDENNDTLAFFDSTPTRPTDRGEWFAVTIPISPLRTVTNMDLIEKVDFLFIAGDLGGSTLFFDRFEIGTRTDIPEQVKIGCMRWIASKYENRDSAVTQEGEGGISRSLGDSIPEEWRNLRRIPV